MKLLTFLFVLLFVTHVLSETEEQLNITNKYANEIISTCINGYVFHPVLSAWEHNLKAETINALLSTQQQDSYIERLIEKVSKLKCATAEMIDRDIGRMLNLTYPNEVLKFGVVSKLEPIVEKNANLYNAIVAGATRSQRATQEDKNFRYDIMSVHSDAECNQNDVGDCSTATLMYCDPTVNTTQYSGQGIYIDTVSKCYYQFKPVLEGRCNLTNVTWASQFPQFQTSTKSGCNMNSTDQRLLLENAKSGLDWDDDLIANKIKTGSSIIISYLLPRITNPCDNTSTLIATTSTSAIFDYSSLQIEGYGKNVILFTNKSSCIYDIDTAAMAVANNTFSKKATCPNSCILDSTDKEYIYNMIANSSITKVIRGRILNSGSVYENYHAECTKDPYCGNYTSYTIPSTNDSETICDLPTCSTLYIPGGDGGTREITNLFSLDNYTSWITSSNADIEPWRTMYERNPDQIGDGLLCGLNTEMVSFVVGCFKSCLIKLKSPFSGKPFEDGGPCTYEGTKQIPDNGTGCENVFNSYSFYNIALGAPSEVHAYSNLINSVSFTDQQSYSRYVYRAFTVLSVNGSYENDRQYNLTETTLRSRAINGSYGHNHGKNYCYIGSDNIRGANGKLQDNGLLQQSIVRWNYLTQPVVNQYTTQLATAKAEAAAVLSLLQSEVGLTTIGLTVAAAVSALMGYRPKTVKKHLKLNKKSPMWKYTMKMTLAFLTNLAAVAVLIVPAILLFVQEHKAKTAATTAIVGIGDQYNRLGGEIIVQITGQTVLFVQVTNVLQYEVTVYIISGMIVLTGAIWMVYLTVVMFK